MVSSQSWSRHQNYGITILYCLEEEALEFAQKSFKIKLEKLCECCSFEHEQEEIITKL